MMRAIRMNAQGVDDVAIGDDQAMFRIERMDTNHFWAACYIGDKRVCFAITSDSLITVETTEDDIGCIDDSKGA